MALRSSLSQLRTSTPSPAVDEADTEALEAASAAVEEVEEEEAAAGPAPTVRGRVAQPAAAAPAVTKAAAGRGRPRLSDEEKAARKSRAPRAPKADLKPAAGSTPASIRAELREIEAEFRTVKEQIAAATAKLQPRVEALQQAHAAASARLAQSLLK